MPSPNSLLRETLSDISSNIDTFNRFSVVIDAVASQIWPFLFRADQWQWFAKVENMQSTGDQVGGIVALYSDGTSPNATCFIKTLRIDLHRHYGFSVYCSDQFSGFGAFDLMEAGEGKTCLTYELYLHNLPFPAQDATDEQIRRITLEAERAQEEDKAQKLALLKALVERHG